MAAPEENSSEAISHSGLDFLGKPDDTRNIHKKTGLPDLTISDHFVYDDNGRLLSQSQTVGGGDPQLIAYNKYDELGQLEGKKGAMPLTAHTTTLQPQEYRR